MNRLFRARRHSLFNGCHYIGVAITPDCTLQRLGQLYDHTIHLLTAIKAYPSITKQRIPVLLRGRLNSLIILSWLYLGINRNPRKCIHPCFRKKCDSARTFLHIAQFRMKAPDKIIDGQNVWSYSCPRRWRVQSGVIATPM